MEKKPKVDYREVLSPDDFKIFDMLRQWRSKQAESADVAVYRILTNENLANIAKLKPQSLSDLEKIPGIGEARVQSYGASRMELMKPMTAPDIPFPE